MRPIMMFHVLNVVPFLCSVVYLIINDIVKLFTFFLLRVFLALLLPFLPLLPSCGLGSGVKGGPPWHLLFGSSLALFVFAYPFPFVTKNADCFSFILGSLCSRLVQYCRLTFLFFLLWCLVLPTQGDANGH